MTRVAPQYPSGSNHPRTANRIRMGRHNIGPDSGVFIVAEAGVNHNGDEGMALRLVDAAVQAGADAVKFQVFNANALATADAPVATYQTVRTAQTSQRTMLRQLELPMESFGRIARRCAQRGIAFLATPFADSDVTDLVAVGAAAIKIASTDLVDVALLEGACGAALPIILSTGAADEDEIAEAVQRIEACDARERLVLMHCVSAYPTAMDHANLRAVRTLQDRFATVVGYSDHTTSTHTGALAVAAGACLLEKHFTLDSHAPGPDHAMSLEPHALAEYIRLARQAHQALGTGSLAVQRIEREVRDIGRKTIVAARDISPGETLTADMLASRRAGRGLLPTQMAKVLGRQTAVAVEADTPLVWEMLRA